MSTSGHLVVKLLAAPTDGKRTVTGFCSTDDVDLVGDVCSPEGCKVAKLPLPLLFGHSQEAIIGRVTSVVPEAKRVRIEATIVEGTAKADEAWTLLRAGALDSFSVGFIGHESTPLKSGGRFWKSWTLNEVSLVACPANPHARVTAVSTAKNFHTEQKVIPGALSKEQKDDIKSIVKDHVAKHGKDPVMLAQVIELRLLAQITVLKNRLNALEAHIGAEEIDSETEYKWFRFSIPEGAEPARAVEFPWWILPATGGRHACTAAIPKDISQTLRDVFPDVEVQKRWTAPLDWSQFASGDWWPDVRRGQLLRLAEQAHAKGDAERLEARLTALERVRR